MQKEAEAYLQAALTREEGRGELETLGEEQLMSTVEGPTPASLKPFVPREERTQGSRHSQEEEAAARLLLRAWMQAEGSVALTQQLTGV